MKAEEVSGTSRDNLYPWSCNVGWCLAEDLIMEISDDIRETVAR